MFLREGGGQTAAPPCRGFRKVGAWMLLLRVCVCVFCVYVCVCVRNLFSLPEMIEIRFPTSLTGWKLPLGRRRGLFFFVLFFSPWCLPRRAPA